MFKGSIAIIFRVGFIMGKYIGSGILRTVGVLSWMIRLDDQIRRDDDDDDEGPTT